MTALAPCPYCGHDASMAVYHRRNSQDPSEHYVVCANARCKVRPYTSFCPSAELAARAWNTRAVATWQPLDTAPKDETEFLAWSAGSKCCGIVSWSLLHKCWIDDSGYAAPVPDRWMPIPPPPEIPSPPSAATEFISA